MCVKCGKIAAISDSGLCGTCLRAPAAVPVIAYHSWAACPGAIVAQRVGIGAIALVCAECGKRVGIVEPGLFENWGASVETVAAFAGVL